MPFLSRIFYFFYTLQYSLLESAFGSLSNLAVKLANLPDICQKPELIQDLESISKQAGRFRYLHYRFCFASAWLISYSFLSFFPSSHKFLCLKIYTFIKIYTFMVYLICSRDLWCLGCISWYFCCTLRFTYLAR